MIGRAPVRERVLREVAPCGGNINVILAINQEMGLVRHQLGQFTVTKNVNQNFIAELVNQASELFSGEDHIHIVYGERGHISTLLFLNHTKSASHCVCCLRRTVPFFNPVEQAHSCFKTFTKNELVRQ